MVWRESREMEYRIPKDPVMLLSYVNTCLRDHYHSLDELCKAENLSRDEMMEALAAIDYAYDAKRNQFI